MRMELYPFGEGGLRKLRGVVKGKTVRPLCLGEEEKRVASATRRKNSTGRGVRKEHLLLRGEGSLQQKKRADKYKIRKRKKLRARKDSSRP